MCIEIQDSRKSVPSLRPDEDVLKILLWRIEDNTSKFTTNVKYIPGVFFFKRQTYETSFDGISIKSFFLSKFLIFLKCFFWT